MFKKTITSQISDCHNDDLAVENNAKEPPGFNVELTEKAYDKIKKILVADDDPAIIDVITLMLESVGYKVYASANEQTIEDINRICPDLILLDILMPGVSGYGICKQLKNQQSTRHIPVIMISANKDAKEIALKAHADDFITKPFEMYNLLQKVATYAKV